MTTVDAMRKVCYFVPAPALFTSSFRSGLFFGSLHDKLTRLTTKQMKQAFDPLCLLNCDKVVRMQKPKAGEVAEW